MRIVISKPYLRFATLLLTALLSACDTMPWDSTLPVEERQTKKTKPVAKPAPEPAAPSQPVPVPAPVPAPSAQKEPPRPTIVCKAQAPHPVHKKPANPLTVLGEVERIRLHPGDITLQARIDTGTPASSLNVMYISEFERDGKPWVRFKITDDRTGKPIEMIRPVLRTVPVKALHIRIKSRPVVQMKAIIGKLEQPIELILTDNKHAKYPLLIGRDFLKDSAIVDVSRRYTNKSTH